MLEIGDVAPSFELPITDDTMVNFPPTGAAILYFYPKDDTPGCTTEAIEFTQAKSDFAALGIEVVGISPDTTKKHEKFSAKHNLDIILLADEHLEALNAYSVWVEKKMYGKTYMGVERSTFLIDADGKIVKIWRKVRVKGHVEAVLEAATSHFKR